jgi:hypothetical protein
MVLGFVDASLLDLDVEIWTVELTKEQINACYSEWKKYKQYDRDFACRKRYTLKEKRLNKKMGV